jgi:peptidoglycan DL-endopeptidase CwlO
MEAHRRLTVVAMPPRRTRARLRAGVFFPLLAVVLALAVLTLAAIQVAGAAPPPPPGASAGSPASATDEKNAAELRRRIDENGWRISALGETYNGVRLRYDEARARAVEVQQHQDRIRQRLDAAETELRLAAAGLYRRAISPAPSSIVPTVSVVDRTRLTRYAQIAAQHVAARIDDLRQSRDRLAADGARATKAIRDVQAARGLLRVTQDRIKAANALQLQMLALIDGRRVADGADPGAIDPALVGADLPQVPVSPRVAAVILYARAQLGKPYIFATSGPATFDCSGLTMMAWRQAGVAMAHFSGAQYAAFPKVALSQLQPGDLVFRGPGGRQHVALYIGGGLQIAATHTGDYVRVQPLMSGISGAVRPG